VKNKGYVWLHIITATLLCGTISAVFTWLVSFLPIFAHVSFWIILLASYIFMLGLVIANDIFNIKLKAWLSIIFIFFYGIIFTCLGIKDNSFIFVVIDMFLSTVTTFIVQVGYLHFKRGANGKTKDN
jgi:hypothetical protein